MRTTVAHSRLLYFYLLLLFPASLLIAQQPSEYTLTLNKRFISWSWLTTFNGNYNIGQNSTLGIQNQFRSNLYRQNASDERWKDENTFVLGWERVLNPKLSLRSYLNSRIFSDENTSVEFNKHLLAQEAMYKPSKRVLIKPALGWTTEQAFDNRDQAIYTRLGIRLSKFDMGDYRNSTDLSSEVRFFPDRKNQDHSLFTGWNTNFSKLASDSLRVGYQYSESRYFLNPTATFLERGIEAPQEQVIINTQFLFNQLTYRTSPSANLVLLTTLRNRALDQSNPDTLLQREEFALENQFQYVYATPRMQLQSGIIFSQTDRDNPGLFTDISSLQTAFSNSLQFKVTPEQRYWARLSFAKYEYNTPNDGMDAEDRDEQRFIVDTGYAWRISPYYKLTLNANVYLFHQIYLRSGRSQNNSWNRIFQLSGAFEHRLGRRWTHQSKLKILANYTVFDFDELLLNVNSFLFRKLIYSDSLAVGITKNLEISSIYQWEQEDNGAFFKNSFSQQILKELSAHFISISLKHRNVFGLHLTSGVSFFIRDEWSFRPERVRVRKFRSFTPRLSLLYPAGKKLLLFLNYAPNRARNRTRSNSSTPFSLSEQNFTSGSLKLTYLF